MNGTSWCDPGRRLAAEQHADGPGRVEVAALVEAPQRAATSYGLAAVLDPPAHGRA
jgi:hypothetical protein